MPFIVNNLFSFGQSFGLEAMGDFRSADKDHYSALIRIQLAIETVCVDVCMWMCACGCVCACVFNICPVLCTYVCERLISTCAHNMCVCVVCVQSCCVCVQLQGTRLVLMSASSFDGVDPVCVCTLLRHSCVVQIDIPHLCCVRRHLALLGATLLAV